MLEVGTGTGYNAALLSHRIGDQHVFSVDIEPDLVQLARERLARIGYRPTLVTADGADGLPEHAPYDRIVGTCSVPSVPWAWVEQVREGGLILVDLKLAPLAGNLVLLHRDDQRADGRFDPTYASFMAMRHVPTSRVPDAHHATTLWRRNAPPPCTCLGRGSTAWSGSSPTTHCPTAPSSASAVTAPASRPATPC